MSGSYRHEGARCVSANHKQERPTGVWGTSEGLGEMKLEKQGDTRSRNILRGAQRT